MYSRYQSRQGGRIFSGVLLTGLGLLLLLGNLNLFPLRFFFTQWWPLILVALGVKRLLMWRGPAAWVGGAFWIGAGLLFLAGTMGFLNVSVSRSLWPLLLIWFGVSMFIGPSGSCRRTLPMGDPQ